mmetsp:Transcript_15679/g.47413  ORF Transcript_15679/g.47413 Transcript_15679/m.47413 type:complete len:133 (-) Transcript_15679:25-423(-)
MHPHLPPLHPRHRLNFVLEPPSCGFLVVVASSCDQDDLRRVLFPRILLLPFHSSRSSENTRPSLLPPPPLGLPSSFFSAAPSECPHHGSFLTSSFFRQHIHPLFYTQPPRLPPFLRPLPRSFPYAQCVCPLL